MISRLRAFLQVPTGIEWALLAAGLFLTLRYAWLLDDAFVYFRYADNFHFLKLGLVYNQGEFVEGFSSPLWMLLTLVLRGLGFDYWLMTRLIGLLSFAAFWALAIAVHRQMTPAGRQEANLPLAFLALNYAVLSYFTSGLEAPLIQLTALCFVAAVLWPRSRVWQFALALSPLIRPEHLLPLAVFVAWRLSRTRRPPVFLVLSTLLLNGAWLLFRIYYYAAFFPNTFYLKNQDNWRQGWVYLWQVMTTDWLLPIGAVAVGLAFLSWRRLAPAGLCWGERGVLTLMALLPSIYVLKIGGDFMHYRYLAFPFVIFFFVGCGLFERVLVMRWPDASPWIGRSAMLAFGLFSLLCYPRQLEKHPLLGPSNLDEKAVRADYIYDANSHRRHEDLSFSPWSLEPMLDLRPRYEHYLSQHDPFSYEEVTNEGWCVEIYKRFDARFVHRWGLTSPVIAHMKLPWRRPGHPKGGYERAREIAFMREHYPDGPTPGMFRWAIDVGKSRLRWVHENQEALALIERRMYNRHSLRENFKLAMMKIPRLDPGDLPSTEP